MTLKSAKIKHTYKDSGFTFFFDYLIIVINQHQFGNVPDSF
jgi:hypothetical protein